MLRFHAKPTARFSEIPPDTAAALSGLLFCAPPIATEFPSGI
jgi:hypothetical protein